MSKGSRRRPAGRKGKAKKPREVRVAARQRMSGYGVSWHRKARDEYTAIDARERVAIQNVIEKLRVDGPGLRAPHQSAVMGDAGEGLRELRPRQGRSRWRPIYRRIGDTFAILAVAPEAEIDSAGYDRQVGEAQKRRRGAERSLG